MNLTSVKEVIVILDYKMSYMKIDSLCVYPLNLSAAELSYVGYQSAILSQNYIGNCLDNDTAFLCNNP